MTPRPRATHPPGAGHLGAPGTGRRLSRRLVDVSDRAMAAERAGQVIDLSEARVALRELVRTAPGPPPPPALWDPRR